MNCKYLFLLFHFTIFKKKTDMIVNYEKCLHFNNCEQIKLFSNDTHWGIKLKWPQPTC